LILKAAPLAKRRFPFPHTINSHERSRLMPEEIRNNRVFISHAGGDSDILLLERMKAMMIRAGFEPVVAEHVPSPMAQLGEKVRTLAEECDFFVGLVTKEGQASEWVQQELGFAYTHHLRDKVIAILVQDGAVLGGFYSGLEYFLFNESTFDRNVDSVTAYFARLQKGDVQLTLTAQRDAELRRTIDRVRADTKQAAIAQLLSTIEPMLDSVVTNLSTAFQDPDQGIMTRCGLDNFSMRTETFVALMDSLQGELTEAPLDRALYRAGMQAGRTFGSDFCDHVLLQNKVTVSSYVDLLNFWLYYDQTSGWGRPRLTRGLPEIIVTVKNSFLVRQAGRHIPHRYCSFFKGYIDGFLQFTMRRVRRYAREAKASFDDDVIYSPRSVLHEAGLEHECSFHISVAEEDFSLKPAFDHLFRAGIANAMGDGLRCVNHSRAAMEFGIKGKLGRKTGDHGSFHEMVKEVFEISGAAQEMSASFRSPKHYREVYGQLSGAIHQIVEPGPEECRRVIVAVDEFLCGLERIIPGVLG
jgi:hypothetical protein